MRTLAAAPVTNIFGVTGITGITSVTRQAAETNAATVLVDQPEQSISRFECKRRQSFYLDQRHE